MIFSIVKKAVGIKGITFISNENKPIFYLDNYLLTLFQIADLPRSLYTPPVPSISLYILVN